VAVRKHGYVGYIADGHKGRTLQPSDTTRKIKTH